MRLLTFCTVPKAATSAPISRANSTSQPLQVESLISFAILRRERFGNGRDLEAAGGGEHLLEHGVKPREAKTLGFVRRRPGRADHLEAEEGDLEPFLRRGRGRGEYQDQRQKSLHRHRLSRPVARMSAFIFAVIIPRSYTIWNISKTLGLTEFRGASY